jgi:hypothetical protein
MMIAPLAGLALTSVRLKLSPKVISTKSILMNAQIAALALMYVLLKPSIRLNKTTIKKSRH